ncbi:MULTISPECIES: DUF6916 family protein [Pseudomonas]|uniref:DUF6916 domain-containing protein n=2 Tax=Pseudomonas TaxID=286 RepID=A0A6B3NM40_9PSED|nr:MULTISPECIES: hypothetical protein [Pseudomonas]MBV6288312.1 hypothetical protein [Pseudomonas aegrilactucae]NER59192.1 hypothetical protein [Pseudomonas brassicae]NER62886.1 hypothetical protein [Pseudomonas brassicae]
MSEPILAAIPSLQELRDADADGFVLQLTPEQGLRVSLLTVNEGVAMNDEHECYSLLLVLPHGVSLPQEVFNLFGPGRQQPWTLLMTPVAPEPDGRHVLEAVIHRRRQVPVDAS